MTTYASEMLVTVRTFTRQSDGEEVVIGNETGSFLAVPQEAVDVLDFLAEGKTIGEARDFCLRKYGESLDIEDFLAVMEAKGFIIEPGTAAIDPMASSTISQRSAPVRYHFANFPRSVAAFVYGPPMLIGYFIVSLLALGALIVDRGLVPRPVDFVFPEHRIASFCAFITVAMGTIYLHELSHVVAARAMGVNSRLAIGHRMWFVVAEADLSGLWAVPKEKRYLPLLAGIITDVVSAAGLILLLFCCDRQWLLLPRVAVQILRALILSYGLRIIWQFYVFVRTDLYFVITTFFNCRNLLSDTEDFLQNLVSRIIRSVPSVDQTTIPNPERRVIRAYSVLWVSGRVVALYVLGAITLPVAFSYARNLSRALQTGASNGVYNLVDSVLFSAFFLISLAVGLFLWVRGIIRRERS